MCSTLHPSTNLASTTRAHSLGPRRPVLLQQPRYSRVLLMFDAQLSLSQQSSFYARITLFKKHTVFVWGVPNLGLKSTYPTPSSDLQGALRAFVSAAIYPSLQDKEQVRRKQRYEQGSESFFHGEGSRRNHSFAWPVQEASSSRMPSAPCQQPHQSKHTSVSTVRWPSTQDVGARARRTHAGSRWTSIRRHNIPSGGVINTIPPIPPPRTGAVGSCADAGAAI